MTHYELFSPRKDRNDKTRWHKVGVAFPRDKGGFSLVFDSLPLPDNEGRVSLMMWEAKPREGQQDNRSQDSGYSQQGRADDCDSEIPF